MPPSRLRSGLLSSSAIRLMRTPQAAKTSSRSPESNMATIASSTSPIKEETIGLIGKQIQLSKWTHGAHHLLPRWRIPLLGSLPHFTPFRTQHFHSFIPDILLCLSKSTTTRQRSQHSTDTVLEFHAKALQATANEGLAQGPYVVARAGFEPTTLLTKGVESTNEPPRPACRL